MEGSDNRIYDKAVRPVSWQVIHSLPLDSDHVLQTVHYLRSDSGR